MIKRIVITIASTFLAIASALAQEQVQANETAKTPVRERDYSVINDYNMIGINYGVGFAGCSFDPVRLSQTVFMPVNAGITYTKYCKLFGYMPYFGFQASVLYTRDGYAFKENEQTGYTDNILYAYKATLETIEIPAMAHLHFDFWKLKLMVNLGIYGGYRFTVNREYLEKVPQARRTYQNSFHVNENRWDYGLKGGAGLALVLDPVEIHFMCFYKYSWSNLHQPDIDARTLEHTEMSKYYYKWSYPTNLTFSVGVHYQITNRIGKTRAEMRKQAREEAIEILFSNKQKNEKDNSNDR